MSRGGGHARGSGARRRPVAVLTLAAVCLAVLIGGTLVVLHLRSPAHVTAASATTHPPRVSPSASHAVVTPGASPTPSATATQSAKPLAGRVVGIDPGHNGGNFRDPDYINRTIWNGREDETCDTTGTETDSGYTEAQYNFNVAQYLRADLQAAGARVVMTRSTNDGVGPCVTTRSQILNDAQADVAVDIHADGGPAWGRGFTVLEPVADGPNSKVIAASDRFGAYVHAAVLAGTRMPVSDYYGHDGYQARDDLAGLNLTTVPKILIECGNMRNATDAAILTSATFQRQIARALAAAITRFLTSS